MTMYVITDEQLARYEALFCLDDIAKEDIRNIRSEEIAYVECVQ